MQKYAFITSTGTNIGKTFLTAMLIKRAIKINHKVNALKPIISGFNINDLNVTDTGIILDSLKGSIHDIDKISPWRFSDPLSPDMAAKNEEKTINFTDLVNF
ncbi:MAG: ATP-dependent dethiobiotin synthetase BioD, partial [Pelagibacterales bacterium]